MMATPAKPVITPVSRCAVIRSSEVSQWATTTVNSGVVAFKIEATPDAICACPYTIRLNGSTLFNSAMTKNARHMAKPLGS